MKEGQMITLAGRPGTGKSALAGQIAYDCAESGGRVAFFSLEMTGEEIVDRLALVRGGRDARGDSRIKTGKIREIGKFKTLHIFDNSEKYTVPSINAKCRLLATQKGGLSFVVIDYLTLITPIDRKQSREQQVAEISRSIKQMAGGLKVPVLVLAQLNRESDKEERRPRLSDLRESGSIEQDSDRVWFLWNDAKNTSQDNEWLDLVLFQAKCRGGPANVAKPLRFDRPIYSFFPVPIGTTSSNRAGADQF
jgi:replicative DNA helicase